ncbi:uncharacterized [Tachysurus ichikawai]
MIPGQSTGSVRMKALTAVRVRRARHATHQSRDSVHSATLRPAEDTLTAAQHIQLRYTVKVQPRSGGRWEASLWTMKDRWRVTDTQHTVGRLQHMVNVDRTKPGTRSKLTQRRLIDRPALKLLKSSRVILKQFSAARIELKEEISIG